MGISKRQRLGIVATLLSFFLPLVAEAYTVVLRDGRHLQVPETFVVDQSGLTYEVSPGIQITLQLKTIDIAATDKANNQPKGSLIGRMARNRTEKTPTQTPSRSGLTITNRDLETFRQARIASEDLYEKRRKELGLPSIEESRRAAMAIGERAQAQLLNMRAQEQESETYWRRRASELRADLAATDARINLVQARLNEIPLNYSFGGFTTFSPFARIDQLGRARWIGPTIFPNSVFFGRLPLFGAPTPFGSLTPRRPFWNPSPRRGFGRKHIPGRLGFGTLVALPFDAYDTSFERSTLLTELDQLLAQRAGLQARWRELEEEARRSGAYPGWLR